MANATEVGIQRTAGSGAAAMQRAEEAGRVRAEPTAARKAGFVVVKTVTGTGETRISYKTRTGHPIATGQVAQVVAQGGRAATSTEIRAAQKAGEPVPAGYVPTDEWEIRQPELAGVRPAPREVRPPGLTVTEIATGRVLPEAEVHALMAPRTYPAATVIERLGVSRQVRLREEEVGKVIEKPIEGGTGLVRIYYGPYGTKKKSEVIRLTKAEIEEGYRYTQADILRQRKGVGGVAMRGGVEAPLTAIVYGVTPEKYPGKWKPTAEEALKERIPTYTERYEAAVLPAYEKALARLERGPLRERPAISEGIPGIKGAIARRLEAAIPGTPAQLYGAKYVPYESLKLFTGIADIGVMAKDIGKELRKEPKLAYILPAAAVTYYGARAVARPGEAIRGAVAVPAVLAIKYLEKPAKEQARIEMGLAAQFAVAEVGVIGVTKAYRGLRAIKTTGVTVSKPLARGLGAIPTEYGVEAGRLRTMLPRKGYFDADLTAQYLSKTAPSRMRLLRYGPRGLEQAVGPGVSRTWGGYVGELRTTTFLGKPRIAFPKGEFVLKGVSRELPISYYTIPARQFEVKGLISAAGRISKVRARAIAVPRAVWTIETGKEPLRLLEYGVVGKAGFRTTFKLKHFAAIPKEVAIPGAGTKAYQTFLRTTTKLHTKGLFQAVEKAAIQTKVARIGYVRGVAAKPFTIPKLKPPQAVRVDAREFRLYGEQKLRPLGVEVVQVPVMAEKYGVKGLGRMVAPVTMVRQIPMEKQKVAISPRLRTMLVPRERVGLLPRQAQMVMPTQLQITKQRVALTPLEITITKLKPFQWTVPGVTPAYPIMDVPPPPPPPPFLLPLLGFGRARRIPFAFRYKKPTKYTPSLRGLWTGITIAKAPKGVLTGLEPRYPVRRKARKRKRRRVGKKVGKKIAKPKRKGRRQGRTLKSMLGRWG